MGLEIEHKYLVRNDDYKKLALSVKHIIQGYLNRDIERTVRIRIVDTQGFLTVKGKNGGDTRLEFEYEIPYTDAQRLLSICEDGVVEKNRYIVCFEGYRWEIDEFMGRLYPLVVAEIELTQSRKDYPLPSFIGDEVTGNPRYYNSMM